MEVRIDETLVEAIEKMAATTGQTVEEFVNGLLEYSFDNGLAVLQMARVEELLTREILPRLMNMQSSQFAVRHQITNLHADILDGPQRAIAISKEASDIGHQMVFDNDEETIA